MIQTPPQQPAPFLAHRDNPRSNGNVGSRKVNFRSSLEFGRSESKIRKRQIGRKNQDPQEKASYSKGPQEGEDPTCT